MAGQVEMLVCTHRPHSHSNTNFGSCHRTRRQLVAQADMSGRHAHMAVVSRFKMNVINKKRMIADQVRLCTAHAGLSHHDVKLTPGATCSEDE